MKKLLLTLAFILGIMISVSAETKNIPLTGSGAATTLTDSPFTVTFAKNDGTTAPTFYSDGVRLYYNNAGNGCSMTVTAEEGTVINSIAFTMAGSYKWLENATKGVGTISEDGLSWTAPDGGVTSVTFQNTNTSNIQVRVAAMAITYNDGEGGGTVTPPVDPDPDDPTPGPGGNGLSFDLNATSIGVTASNSYKTDDITFSAADNTFVLNNVIANANYLQARGNQTPAASNFYLYNTSPIENIKEVRITVSSGASTIGATLPVSSFGDAAQTTAISTGTTATTDNNVLVFTAPTSGTSYFRVQFLNKSTSGNCQINKVEIITESVAGKETVTLTYPEAVVNTTLGQSFTAPTLSVDPAAALSEVKYSSSNEKVATVDAQGNVTLKNVLGATTITASISDSDKYTSATATYTLNVVAEGVYTVAQALEAINNGYTGTQQVKGYISSIQEVSTEYGNATYNIVDVEGTTEPALTVFRGKWLNGDKFTSADQIAVGGLVIVEGNLVLYGGNTPEVETNNTILSYTPPTTTEPEPENSVTFNFTGVQNAWYYVNVYDVDNGEVVDVDKSSMSFPNTSGALFSISAKDGYSLNITCTTEGLVDGTDYLIMGNSANGTMQYMVGYFKQGTDISFDVNVTQVATPEVTINFTGAYKDNLTFTTMGKEQDITSGSYILDLSDIEDDEYPYILSFQVPEGYSVDITGNMAQSEETWQIQSVGQATNGAYVGIFGPGAAGLELTVNVTAEAEEIPADAYVVYYSGEVASNINQYDWWNASWNAQAMNPDGVGMAFEFKAADGGAAASMGLAGATADVVGKLHNATLNFDWYAVGTGSYKLQLTGGGKNYFYEINPADVPAGTDIAWNSVSIDIATQWPELAEAWNVNTAKDEYLFAVLLSDGTEGDAIYFNKIYYTNVDESWTAPEAPAPETVPAPEQPQDMMLSVVSDNGSIQYSFGSWGQSTQAENTFIAGSPVIAMTNFNYLGLEFSAINVSDYDYMHVDYWTNSENTPFTFVPISLDPTQEGEPYKDSNVKANEWNSYDAPLSSFAANMEALRQIKFTTNVDGHDVTPYGYIANVYFWKENEPNVFTLNITGGDDAWQHVGVYNAQDDEEVILLENTYSITNYAKGQVLSIQAKEGYQVEVTCATEGLEADNDYQIISQDQNGVVSYLIGMVVNDVDVIFNAAVTELVIPEVTFTFTGVENAWKYVNIWDAANSENVGLAGETVSFPNNVTQLLSISAKEGYEITIECTTEGLEADKDYQIQGSNVDGIMQYMVGGFKQGIDINFDINVTPIAPKLVTVNLTGDYEDNVIFVVSVGDDSEVITENPYSLNLNNYEDDEFPIILTFQAKEEGISIDVTGNMEQSESTWQEMSVGQAMNGVNIAIWGPDAAGLELTAFAHEAIDNNMYLGITTDGTAPAEYNKDYVLTTKDGGKTYTGDVKLNAGESFNLWYNTNIQTTDVEDQPVNSFMPMGPATDEEFVITFTNNKTMFEGGIALTTTGFWTLGNDVNLELTLNIDIEDRTINIVNNTEITPGMLNTLVFEDWKMSVSQSMTAPKTAEVPVSLEVDEPFAYQGFQFDIQLPAGLELVDPITLNSALNGNASFSLLKGENNAYRVIAHSDWAEDGYNLTEDLVTLTVATTYPSEDGLATLIADGDYNVTISNVDFSDVLGDDIDNFNDFTGVVTIVSNVPATGIEFESVTLMEPSYTTPSVDPVETVVQGESVAMEIVVTPEDTSDELKVTANNGASVEFDAETGNWILDTTNAAGKELAAGETIEVTVTATAGDVTETYTIKVKGVLLGDSNDNGVVTVADVVTTANYMVKSPVETFCFPNANVILTPGEDGEQVIDASDLSATINIVLDNFDGKRQVRRQAGRIATNDRLVGDNFKVVNDKPFVIGVNLDNTYDYSVLQATVEVPEGMNVLSVEKGPRAAAHELTFNHLENGTVKVVLYSLANEAFGNGEGSLFNLIVTADSNCGNLNIVDILASDERSFGYDLSYEGGLNESNTTGIDGLDAEEGDVHYFTVDGLEVVNPQPGQIVIRVQNGNATKVLVK